MSILRGIILVSGDPHGSRRVPPTRDEILASFLSICAGKIAFAQSFVQNSILGVALMDFSNHAEMPEAAAKKLVEFCNLHLSMYSVYCEIALDYDGQRKIFFYNNMIADLGDLSESFG